MTSVRNGMAAESTVGNASAGSYLIWNSNFAKIDENTAVAFYTFDTYHLTMYLVTDECTYLLN